MNFFAKQRFLKLLENTEPKQANALKNNILYLEYLFVCFHFDITMSSAITIINKIHLY